MGCCNSFYNRKIESYVEQDYKKAEKWYLQAASQGEERAKLRLRELRRGKKG